MIISVVYKGKNTDQADMASILKTSLHNFYDCNRIWSFFQAKVYEQSEAQRLRPTVFQDLCNGNWTTQDAPSKTFQ